jgi:hypothetical protein
MLGYYLLLIPLVVCVGSELRQRAGPIVDLFTVAGVLYDLFWHTFTIDELDVDLEAPLGGTREATFTAPPGPTGFTVGCRPMPRPACAAP